MFDIFRTLYKPDDEQEYVPQMGDAYFTTSKGASRDEAKRRRYYRMWRQFQLSDQLPMWVELKIDFGEEYLRRRAKKPSRRNR